jgi:cellulose synthase/poly-beta-1,6-N-acetylglucosamine synthase-like glycosyltransferase
VRYLYLIESSNFGIALLSFYLLSFIIPLGIGIYLVINFFSAPRRYKKIIYTEAPKTFFAVVIPARNEERVIEHTIQSLRTIQYPAALYEIIVIADNCTDHTEQFARKEGVQVYVRQDLNRRSKAHAMKWLFEQEIFIEKKYDAICILDADATLAPDFLHAMDVEIRNGYEIVQGRCGSSNPNDSMTSGFMTALASVQNRLWYLPQANRNRSGFYIGTGVCITLARIKKTGWHISTLVEDAEFSIQSVLKGGFVRYCDHARYFVEQVTTWKQLWKQQRRWRTGQIDCLKKYLKPLFLSVFKDRNKNTISLLILVLIPVLCILSIFQTIATPILFGEFFGYDKFQPVMIAVGVGINFIVMFAFYCFILWMDDTFSIKLWKGIIAVIFSPYFYGLVDIVSVFRPKKEWNPILHGQSKWFLSKENRKQLGIAKHRTILEKQQKKEMRRMHILLRRMKRPLRRTKKIIDTRLTEE